MNSLASIAGLAGPDLIIILLIVLVLFGAKKLPELAKGMGQAIKEFNKAKDEITSEIHKPVTELTVQKPADQQEHNPSAAAPAPEPVEKTEKAEKTGV
jgi:sec-independent protein translocase protein TatA